MNLPWFGHSPQGVNHNTESSLDYVHLVTEEPDDAIDIQVEYGDVWREGKTNVVRETAAPAVIRRSWDTDLESQDWEWYRREVGYANRRQSRRRRRQRRRRHPSEDRSSNDDSGGGAKSMR